MIRTRDFLLFLITVAFLIVIITAETARQWFANEPVDVPLVTTPIFTDNAQNAVSAEVVIVEGVDRAGNIARLREQLASFLAQPPKTEEVIDAPAPAEAISTTTSETVVQNGTALLCGGYSMYAGNWPNQLLNIEEQEGVRVVSVDSGSTGMSAGKIVTILPIRTLGNPSSPSCLPTDVVAIAFSGGLIRNDEASGYRAFPDHVLIGYTIDGFPLYGYSARPTDRCGGAVVDDMYRYYLSEKRETVLDCFVAPPVSLP